MTAEQTRALVTIALAAMHADGGPHERERARLATLASRFRAEGVDLEAVERDLAQGRVDVEAVALSLAGERALAQLAYEVAVGVADSDGVHTPAEGQFLERLAASLKLPPIESREIVAQADSIASAAGGATAPASADAAEIDKRILDASITNAALELLPETLASMAILPLQVRLVYRIGQAHGFELDSGHIKEFIATLGVGLTGQYLEQFGRRLLGGLVGSILGGVGRSLGRQAASSGMAFATTWAIGQVAKQYYGGGRTLDSAKLKAAFTPLFERGQSMIAQYAPAIEERARSIDLRRLPELIRRV
jgi:uncharacterized protein (DUF697 family)/tellurite resistance protein